MRLFVCFVLFWGGGGGLFVFVSLFFLAGGGGGGGGGREREHTCCTGITSQFRVNKTTLLRPAGLGTNTAAFDPKGLVDNSLHRQQGLKIAGRDQSHRRFYVV